MKALQAKAVELKVKNPAFFYDPNWPMTLAMQVARSMGIAPRIADAPSAQQSDHVREYQAKAERGDGDAEYALGNCYANGEGVKQNFTEAVKWYRKAAEKGNAKAQFNLGVCYDRGEGVEQYIPTAVEWYRKAAVLGFLEAQYWLGFCYLNGHGVEKDFSTAVEWYRQAADRGHAQSQNELGRCYFKGEGMRQNFAEAVRWYRKAAEQGNADAQYNLGYCYENGYGVERNIVESEKWYRRNAEGERTATEAGSAPTANSAGIDMIRENDVLKVPVQLNGAISLKFVVDSGASYVQIPKDVFLTLIRAETIQEKDFLPGKIFVLADGSKVKSDRFILRSVKVGELTFSDVEASVGGLEAELLLGQSFLSKFTEWKIDNKNGKLILTK